MVPGQQTPPLTRTRPSRTIPRHTDVRLVCNIIYYSPAKYCLYHYTRELYQLGLCKKKNSSKYFHCLKKNDRQTKEEKLLKIAGTFFSQTVAASRLFFVRSHFMKLFAMFLDEDSIFLIFIRKCWCKIWYFWCLGIPKKL